MHTLDIPALITWTLNGLVGLLLIVGLSNAPARRQTVEGLLLEENNSLKKKNRHLSGHNRSLQDTNTFLQNTLKRNEDRNKESQLARARLNGELVRRTSQNRSLELALQGERNKARGRR